MLFPNPNAHNLSKSKEVKFLLSFWLLLTFIEWCTNKKLDIKTVKHLSYVFMQTEV